MSSLSGAWQHATGRGRWRTQCATRSACSPSPSAARGWPAASAHATYIGCSSQELQQTMRRKTNRVPRRVGAGKGDRRHDDWWDGMMLKGMGGRCGTTRVPASGRPSSAAGKYVRPYITQRRAPQLGRTTAHWNEVVASAVHHHHALQPPVCYKLTYSHISRLGLLLCWVSERRRAKRRAQKDTGRERAHAVQARACEWCAGRYIRRTGWVRLKHGDTRNCCCCCCCYTQRLGVVPLLLLRRRAHGRGHSNRRTLARTCSSHR